MAGWLVGYIRIEFLRFKNSEHSQRFLFRINLFVLAYMYILIACNCQLLDIFEGI